MRNWEYDHQTIVVRWNEKQERYVVKWAALLPIRYKRRGKTNRRDKYLNSLDV